MSNPKELLAFALEKYPEKVEVAPMRDLVMESARQNPKRPAYVKLAVPDEVVKGLRGAREGDRVALVVLVPKDVAERSESRIVLPGEVG